MDDYSEDYLQSQCYLWFHNTFPSLRGLLCYNLNNSRNKIDGNKNNAMGLQKGRSDLVLYFDKKATMIEMKIPSENQSPCQKKWESKIKEQGFEYYVVKSLDDFQCLISTILKITQQKLTK